MYITPSSIDKAAIMPSQVAIIDIASARSLTPDIRVSIEGEMHRQVYLTREDVCAVVHSHPLFASLYSFCQFLYFSSSAALCFCQVAKVLGMGSPTVIRYRSQALYDSSHRRRAASLAR